MAIFEMKSRYSYWYTDSMRGIHWWYYSVKSRIDNITGESSDTFRASDNITEGSNNIFINSCNITRRLDDFITEPDNITRGSSESDSITRWPVVNLAVVV